MWYNVDIYKLSAHLIPPFLRKKRLFSFFQVFLYPFYRIVQGFKNFRNTSLYKLNTNGQVMYIEKYLNDYYHLEYKDIYITDSDRYDSNIPDLYSDDTITMAVYSDNSDHQLYLSAGAESVKKEDYIVNVPSYLSDKIEELKLLIDFTRPAGRKYIIKTYDYE